MATAHQLHLLGAVSNVRIVARVGAARWTVDLDACALAALGIEANELSPPVLARIMENVKAKAVGLHWFGGGEISLSPSELTLPAPAPIRLPDGSQIDRTPWYAILAVVWDSQKTKRLRSVR